MAYRAPTLRHEQFIYAVVDTETFPRNLRRLNINVEEGVKIFLRQIGDAAEKRMRRNVSANRPYGTTDDTIVRRRGDVYGTIGYKLRDDPSGAFLIVGAIRGTAFGRQLALVHDQGATISAKRAWFHGGRMHKYLIFPPPGSPARDADGMQIMTANESRDQFYAQWDEGNTIMVRRTASSAPEVAFIKAKKVDIPARKIISREFAFIRTQIDAKLPTALRTALRVEKKRI